MHIRPETPADIAAIHALNAEAFGQEGEARLVDELRRSPEFIPELSLVAVDRGEIVGHILFSPIRVEGRGGGGAVAALALAPMAVRPKDQNNGIGSALVHRGLERARALGHQVVVVVGHPLYYPRFGFTPAREKGIEASFPVPDEAFMVLELALGALTGVAGTVRYPQAFASLE